MNTTGWAKQHGTSLLSVFSPIIDQFSTFFHWHTVWTICNNVGITFITTPQMHLYTTFKIYLK